jgi:hypothetical protein
MRREAFVTTFRRISVSRTLQVLPSTVFAIVRDPKRQVEIDGSGMLQAAPDSKLLLAVGDTFEMDMDREPLGDLPMGKYKALNTVTKFIPNALLEWNVGSKERGAFGHVFGWEMSLVGSGETEVTNYCDWSDTPEQAWDKFPIVPKRMMEKSVENLAALVGRCRDRH